MRGKIAFSISGNRIFSAEHILFFHEKNGFPRFSGGNGGGKPGRTRTAYDHIKCHSVLP